MSNFMKNKCSLKVCIILLTGILFLDCNFGLPGQNAVKNGDVNTSSGLQSQNAARAETANPQKSAIPLYDPASGPPPAAEIPGIPGPAKKPNPKQNSTPINNPVSPNGPYDGAAVPQADIEAALASARQDGKRVLLDFGANWCPDCLVLSRLFEDPTVNAYIQDHFYTVKIDVGNWDKNLDVVQKYGNPIKKGIPAVVVLTPGGEILATTDDGALANARTASAADIMGFLKIWAAK